MNAESGKGVVYNWVMAWMAGSRVSSPDCILVQSLTLLVWMKGAPTLDDLHTPPPPAMVSTVAACLVRSFW